MPEKETANNNNDNIERGLFVREIEGHDPAVIGRTNTVGFQLSEPSAEPDWNGHESAEILFTLWSTDATILPTTQPVTLPRLAATEEVVFEVTPTTSGTIMLTLNISDARTLAIISTREYELDVIAETTDTPNQ